MDEKRDLRRKDVITAVLLFVLGAAMFATATTYPMTESYGGVKNVWYVSPALFPMIIATLLMLLAAILGANGIRYMVTHGRPESAAFAPSPRWTPFLFITGTLIAFVYFYIPAVDFWIASMAYMFLFVTRFYIHDTFSLARSGGTFIAFGVVMRAMEAASELENMTAQFWRDGLATAFFALLIAHAFRTTANHVGRTRAVKIALAVVVVTTTFLVIAFKFGVLLPMPREGFYCYYAEEAYFTAREFLFPRN